MIRTSRPELPARPEARAPGAGSPLGRPKCQGRRKADGAPCGATVTAESGQRYCPFHDPAHSVEEKQAWARRGSIGSTARRLAKNLEKFTPALAERLAEEAPNLGPPPSLATADKLRGYMEKVVQKAEHGLLNPSTVTAITGVIAQAIRLGELQVEKDMLDLELAQNRESDRPRVQVDP